MVQLMRIFIFLGCLLINLSQTFTSKISDPSGVNYINNAPKLLESFEEKLSKLSKVFVHSPGGSLRSYIDKPTHPDNHKRKSTNVQLPSLVAEKSNNQLYQFLLHNSNPLDQINTAPLQKNNKSLNHFVNLFIFLGIFPFLLATIYYDSAPVCVTAVVAINGYGIASLILGFFYGYLSDHLLFFLAYLVGGTYTILHSLVCKDNHTTTCVFCFFSMLFSSFIYNVYAGLPFNNLSPSYTGLAGLIFNTKIFGNNLFYLTFLHFFILLILAVAIFFCLPSFLRGFPVISNKGEHTKISDYIFSACAAWPFLSIVMQLLYVFNISTTNPVDPLSFFHIPTQLQWNKWESYFAILFWCLLTEGYTEVMAIAAPHGRKSIVFKNIMRMFECD